MRRQFVMAVWALGMSVAATPSPGDGGVFHFSFSSQPGTSAPDHPHPWCRGHHGCQPLRPYIILRIPGPPAPPPLPTVAEARAMLDAGRISEALAALQQRADANPQDPDLWAQLGRAQRKLRHYGEAQASLGRALRLDAGHPVALAEHGLLALTTGDIAGARASLAALAASCGDCPELARLRSALTGAGYHEPGTGAKWVRVGP